MSMKMQKRLAKHLRKFGSSRKDADSLAEYLVSEGWSDRVQRVTVVQSGVLQPTLQQAVSQLPDMRSMPVDHKKTRFVK